MVITNYIYSLKTYVVPSNLQEMFYCASRIYCKAVGKISFFSQHLQVEELTKGDVVSMMTPLVSKEDM